jgi:hypothetical protein
VVEAVLQGLGAEQHRQRHGHGAELVDRHVRHRRLEALRHDDGHAVAAPHALRPQGVRQAVGLGLQLRVAVALGAAVLLVAADRDAPRTVGRTPRQRIAPALPIERRLCSELPTSPMVARQSTCTLRISPERSRSWA